MRCKQAIQLLIKGKKNPLKDKDLQGGMRQNIYDSKDFQSHYKKWHLIHYVFKYRLLIPFIYLTKKVLGRHLLDQPADHPWNVNLKAFTKAYDTALLSCPKHMKSILEHFKRVSLTISLEDTAYREFLNIFMHNLTSEYVKKCWKTEITQFNTAWDKTIIDWNVLFRRHMERPSGIMRSVEYWEKHAEDNLSCQLLKHIKQVIITLASKDSDIEEFVSNFVGLACELMLEEYKDERKPIAHLFYSSDNVYDVDYFHLFRKIKSDKCEYTVFLKGAESGFKEG